MLHLLFMSLYGQANSYRIKNNYQNFMRDRMNTESVKT
jgi:hypothetical protein